MLNLLVNCLSNTDRNLLQLTLSGPMEFSIMFYTVKSGCSIIYFKEPQVIISKNIVFLSLNIDFVLANSADPDKMLNFAAFHPSLQCLPKTLSRGFGTQSVN